MPRKADIVELSAFQQQLVGTWTNQNLPGSDKGGALNPYSYNVMPLPQTSGSIGYVLKNFTYVETIVFKGPWDVARPVAAPNRGGDYEQNPVVLFYDQQIRFAEGPSFGAIVHEENGAWLYLTTQKQQIGPYLYPKNDPKLEPGEPKPQPSDQTMCKQISVPHGVSVLALGSFAEYTGDLKIPDAPSVLPDPDTIDTDPYREVLDTPDNYQNPQPELTGNVNRPLQEAIADLDANGHPVSNYIHCHVESTNGGTVVNIPFEQRRAALAGYSADYWLLSYDGGMNYDILAYTQLILLDIPINGTHHRFPHPTSNVLTRLT